MKKFIPILALICCVAFIHAQDEASEEKSTPVIIRCGASIDVDSSPLYIVDGVPFSDEEVLKKLTPVDMVSIEVIKGLDAAVLYGVLGKNGVILIQTKNATFQNHSSSKCLTTKYPFKIDCVANKDWFVYQDVYNALEAKVPSIDIQNDSYPTKVPRIRLRGQEITEVIVDGVRYDLSILNSLGPNSIETIKVAASAAALTYYNFPSSHN
jgi:outer membrane receptor for ferrienterochelin and colicin